MIASKRIENLGVGRYSLQPCPYRQDLLLFCGEECGKGNAIDCPIWLKESGLLAQSIEEESSAKGG